MVEVVVFLIAMKNASLICLRSGLRLRWFQFRGGVKSLVSLYIYLIMTFGRAKYGVLLYKVGSKALQVH